MNSKVISRVLRFTPNEKIDSIKVGDSAEIIGYVDDFQWDMLSPNNRYFKIVLNNEEGRRVQIIAWNEMASRICGIDRLHRIMHFKNLEVRKSPERIYNLGNVDYELVVQDCTIFRSFGNFDTNNIPLYTLPFAVNRLRSLIRIEGYIKEEPKINKSIIEMFGKSEEYFWTCKITDGMYVLDVRLPQKFGQFSLKLGQAVSLIGKILPCHRSIPKLIVKQSEDVKPIPDRKNMPLAVVHMSNQYPKYCLLLNNERP